MIKCEKLLKIHFCVFGKTDFEKIDFEKIDFEKNF